MTVRPLGLAGILIAVLAAQACAGRIQGQLWLSPEVARSLGDLRVVSTARRGTSDFDRLRDAQRTVSDAVLYVEKIPERTDRKLSRPTWWSWLPWVDAEPTRLKRMIQARHRFDPRVMVVPAGSSIELQNLDRVYHNTFSVSAAKRFDLGKYPPGMIDTLTFGMRGIVNLHCDIHPEEIGYVVVVPNYAYTAPDSLGRFRLPSLPAGAYRMRYWHPAHGEEIMGVVIPPRGDVTLELVYQ